MFRGVEIRGAWVCDWRGGGLGATGGVGRVRDWVFGSWSDGYSCYGAEGGVGGGKEASLTSEELARR